MKFLQLHSLWIWQTYPKIHFVPRLFLQINTVYFWLPYSPHIGFMSLPKINKLKPKIVVSYLTILYIPIYTVQTSSVCRKQLQFWKTLCKKVLFPIKWCSFNTHFWVTNMLSTISYKYCMQFFSPKHLHKPSEEKVSWQVCTLVIF
jgi:hypothetical protein